jgi:macrolide transport system ATP-binding/permease protein
METLIQDIKFGSRRLLKSPGFASIAIISLALGVGANTAIFSLVNAVLLRPLPVAHPEEIMSVAVRGKNDAMDAFSYPNYIDFRDRNQVLSGLIVERFAAISLSRNGNNQRVWAYLVSGNYFDVLGVRAIKGRTFLPEEDRTRLSHPVVVVSYRCWQSRFGGDPDLVGKEILLNNHPFKVIGIAPEGFSGTEIIFTPEIWVPVMMDEWIEPGSKWLDQRDSRNLFGIGRLKSGVSVKQAEASLNLLAEDLGREYPSSNEGQTIKLFPPGLILPDIQGAVVSFAWILMGAVGLVLLIACTNLASLLLARGTERRREIAIRLSLGANRFRLIRQLLTESVLLSLAGGLAGVGLAVWITDIVVALRPPIDFPLTFALAIDWRVMVFALLISLVTGVLFGLMPALQATNPDLVSALKDTSSQAGYRRSFMRSGLVVAQLAFSLVLLIGAGLVVRALQQLETMNPGFEIENRMELSMDLGLQGYDEARGQQFLRQAVERVTSLPEVKSAAVATFIPLSLNYSSNTIFVEGQPAERGANIPSSMVSSVGVGYFETLGVPLIAGRAFTEQDKKGVTRVAIVNETFTRRLLPNIKSPEDALGRRISFESPEGPFLQIVGVAKDGKYFNIGEAPRAFLYRPMLQSYDGYATLVVRTTGDPSGMISSVRSAVQSLDENMPLFDVKTMSDHMRLSLFPARVAAAILGGFGLLALILAAIGIYGVTAYSVAQRTREIGIRMALGANWASVSRMIVGQGLRLAAIGLAIGLTVALVLTRLMSDLLFGVSPTDPVTYAAILIILGGVAVAACLVPARRAAKVDPMIALRQD